MPWWNLKYKTRWHADGSVVSGDPVIVSILWNEVGRGTSMHDLEDGINNQDKIEQLTSAVFSAQAPHWTDFFSASTISMIRLKPVKKSLIIVV